MNGVLASTSLDSLTIPWGSLTGTLTNQTDLKNALDEKRNAFISATTATAASTAAKIVTTSGGSYTPTVGDVLLITYTSGQTAASATLNIDGSGARNVRLQNANAATLGHTTAAGGVLMYYYDGTYYHLIGSQQQSDANTTYTGWGFTPAAITTNTTGAINRMYIANSPTELTVTLPATSAVGSVIGVTGLGTGGFKVAAASGDNILIEGNDTGVTGYLTGGKYDTVYLMTTVANTTWQVVDYTGTLADNNSNTYGNSTVMVYPPSGVAVSTGSAWDTSLQVGTGANNLVQLNASSQLPAVSGVNLTNLTAANLTGTIPSTVLGNSTVYIGTTGIALNRASGALSLTGVNIDGNAGSATKLQTARTIAGVSFDGTANIAIPFANLSSIPTTLAGYGITDAVPTSRTITAGNGLTGGGALSSNITLTLGTPSPTTLSSSDTVTTSSHSHSFAPGGTAAQYITGAGALATFPTIPQGTVTSVAMTVPTGLTVTGSPITTSGTLALGLASGYSIPTTAKQTQWDTAYSWGNHAGLYLPLTGGTVTGNITAPTFTGNLVGNADTATKLATARTINGTLFDGTTNITTANWGTARNITIGDTTKSVNGSVDVIWNVEEMAPNKPVSLTYADLINKINASELVPGTKYLLTDYQTVYTQPVTNVVKSGPIEPLILTAVTSNEIDKVAKSTIYPQDIIWYNHVNDQTQVRGATKGYIYKRHDTLKDNDVGFDFRNVQFRRWQVTGETYSPTVTYPKFKVVKSGGVLYASVKANNIGNAVTNKDWWINLQIEDNLFIGHNSAGAVSLNLLFTPTGESQDFYMFQNYDNDPFIQDNRFIQSRALAEWIPQNQDIIDGNNMVFIPLSGYIGDHIIEDNEFAHRNQATTYIYTSVGHNTWQWINYYNTYYGAVYNNNFQNHFRYNFISSSGLSATGTFGFRNSSMGIEFSNNVIAIPTEKTFGWNTIGNAFKYNFIHDNFNNNSITEKFEFNNIQNIFIDNRATTVFSQNIIRALTGGNTFLGQVFRLETTHNVTASTFRQVVDTKLPALAIGRGEFSELKGVSSTSPIDLSISAAYTSASSSEVKFVTRGIAGLGTYRVSYLDENKQELYWDDTAWKKVNASTAYYAEPSTAPTSIPSVASGITGSIAIGDGAQANANNVTAIGTNAGSGANNASISNFFGSGAGYGATGAARSNFFGPSAGYQASNSSFSNFFGQSAGLEASNSSYSNLFGYKAGMTFSGNNIGSNNIIIGTNISLPNAVANSMNIGGVLFGTGLQSNTSGNPVTTPVAGGRVGIGTSTPGYRLTVEDTANPLQLVGLQMADLTDMLLTVNESTGVVRRMYSGSLLSLTDARYIINQSDSDQVANFRISGSAYLGTSLGIRTLPTYALDVGNSSISGIVARFTNSTGNCTINPNTTSLTCSSDINLKKNIELLATAEPFTLETVTFENATTSAENPYSALEKLSKLQVVKYNWNSDTDNTPKRTGFIAQNIEQIFPDLVSTDTDGMKGVNYAGMTPYLVAGVNELSEKSIFANVGSSTLINNTIKTSLNNLALTLASTTILEEQQTLLTNLENLFSTSSLASIKALTNTLTQSNFSLNLNDNALTNIKALESASGNWRITEAGMIEVTKLCIKNSTGNYVCITGDDLESLGLGIASTQEEINKAISNPNGSSSNATTSTTSTSSPDTTVDENSGTSTIAQILSNLTTGATNNATDTPGINIPENPTTTEIVSETATSS
ncbi:MAG: tail fiber domain-containing protein [Anaerolineaceae bacterium]|nr:tail fiber domain-containing protein [Anaerolineaceae bacterium]